MACNIARPFALQENFLGPKYDADGKTPWGPVRYKQILQERFFISKHTNITYKDTGEMSPHERESLRDIIYEDLLKKQESLEKAFKKDQGG